MVDRRRSVKRRSRRKRSRKIPRKRSRKVSRKKRRSRRRKFRVEKTGGGGASKQQYPKYPPDAELGEKRRAKRKGGSDPRVGYKDIIHFNRIRKAIAEFLLAEDLARLNIDRTHRKFFPQEKIEKALWRKHSFLTEKELIKRRKKYLSELEMFGDEWAREQYLNYISGHPCVGSNVWDEEGEKWIFGRDDDCRKMICRSDLSIEPQCDMCREGEIYDVTHRGGEDHTSIYPLAYPPSDLDLWAKRADDYYKKQ